ncbi:MAG: cytochrome P450 [Micrococcus sp.]|nr:cytochrome P450 [Micrococcus sp.]
MTTTPADTLGAPSPVDAALDLFSEEVLQDSMPVYARLREQSPVVHLEQRDLWVITRYEDVRAALGDPETFSSTQVAFNEQMNEVLRGTSLATDPPHHQKLRAVLSENLTPRALRGMKADIEAKADALVAELVARGSFDGMEDLAKHFVTSVVMDMIGVQGDVRQKMLAWGEAAFNLLGPMNERAASSFPVAGELFEWTHHRLRAEDLTEGSMGRAVFEAAERGDIAPESAGMIVHQYIAAGMDTTIASLGNAIVLFARHPEQFQALREDRTLVPSAFAEVQRFLTPMPVVGRLVTRDVEVQGLRIPGGSQAALLLGAANRDPRHFEDPEVFDIRRNPTDHLSFGYGIHGCAGQGLARLEAHAVLDALATRLKGFTVADVRRRLNNMTRPFEAIPVTSVEPAEG